MAIRAANIGEERERIRVEPLPKEPAKELPKSPERRETKRRKREKVPA